MIAPPAPKRKNPRRDCLVCIGTLYCCKHYHQDADDYTEASRGNDNNIAERRLKCVCGKGCTK